MLEFSKENTNREKHSKYEQPFTLDSDELSTAVNKVFLALSSGYLQLYQVVDPQYSFLGNEIVSIYAAHSFDGLRPFVECHLSEADKYTPSQIRAFLENLRPYDLSTQFVVNPSFFINLATIIQEEELPFYVGDIKNI